MGKNLRTAFLLTAGIGSRLAPHTHKKPKPSLPFLGLPLMNYGFYLTQQAGFQNYLFNLHHLPELLLKDIESLKPKMKKHHFLDETQELLGSGGAIWNARSILKNCDYFLVANGDEILIPEKLDILNDLINYFQQTQPLCTLLTCEHPELLKSLKPAWVNEKGRLLGFGMDPITPSAQPLHYTGYKVFSSRILDLLPAGNSHIFYDVFVDAIKKGDLINTFTIDSCRWHETGNFKAFTEASKNSLEIDLDYLNNVHQFYGNDMELLQNNKDFLYKPKNLNLPQNFQWSGVVSFGKNVKLGQNIKLHNVFVESCAQIKDNIHLKDQFVFAD